MPKKQYQPRQRIHPKIDPKTGRTHQSFKEETDINNLVDHWLRTGVASFSAVPPQYLDVSDLPDAHTARNHIAYADQQFALLSDEDKEKYETPLGYFEALLEAANQVGTDDPLVVTVPTDTPPQDPGQKGDKNDETQVHVKTDKS